MMKVITYPNHGKFIVSYDLSVMARVIVIDRDILLLYNGIKSGDNMPQNINVESPKTSIAKVFRFRDTPQQKLVGSDSQNYIHSYESLESPPIRLFCKKIASIIPIDDDYTKYYNWG